MTWKKTVRHIVHWDSAIPTCSCNGLTFSGLPCCHIICTAYTKHKKIPIDCFNKRFWDSDHEDPQIHDEDDEESENNGASDGAGDSDGGNSDGNGARGEEDDESVTMVDDNNDDEWC